MPSRQSAIYLEFWASTESGSKPRRVGHRLMETDEITRLESEEREKDPQWSPEEHQHLEVSWASGPITSWQIDGETVEAVADFIFLGSKITADGDCSHEIKRCLLLGRKVMTNLDSILKSRNIT